MGGRPWTGEEIQALRDNYIEGEGIESIMCLLPERTPRAVEHKITRLGISGRTPVVYGKSHWTDKELQVLREVYPLHGSQAVADKIKRTVTAIQKKARALGLKCELWKKTIGKRFGRLEVLEKLPNSEPTEGNPYGSQRYLCRCECGKKVEVSYTSLISGSSRSCGCLRGEISAERGKDYIINEEGNRYGRLVVDSYNEELSSTKGNAWWNCSCDCGGTTVVKGSVLRRQGVLSCGCLRSIVSHFTKIGFYEDLTEQYFGRWLVVAHDDERTEQTRRQYWHCRCQCGTERSVLGSALRSGSSQSCGCKWQDRMVELGYWSGTPTPLRECIRNSDKYKAWRTAVFERDSYTCRICGERSPRDLQAHHLESMSRILRRNKITSLEDALECEELWDIANGVSIREVYHLGVATDNPSAFHRFFGTHPCTKEDFYEWLDSIGVGVEPIWIYQV